MKLRIKGDSLRLRLQRGEVAALVEEGRVSERIAFAPGRALGYAIVCSDDDSASSNPDIRAELHGDEIVVSVPRRLAQRWHASEEVGLSAEQANGAGSLRILIEKDFACLKPREGEDESDNFEHPLAANPAEASRC